MSIEAGSTKNRFSTAERAELTVAFQTGFNRLAQSIPAGHSKNSGSNNHFDEDFDLQLKKGLHLDKLPV